MVLLQRPFIAIETAGKNVVVFVIGHKGNGGMTVIDHIFCGKVKTLLIIGSDIDKIGVFQFTVKSGEGQVAEPTALPCIRRRQDKE